MIVISCSPTIHLIKSLSPHPQRPPCRYGYVATRCPWSYPFSRLDKSSSLSISSQEMCSSPSTIMVALHPTRFSYPVSFGMGMHKAGCSILRVVLQTLNKRGYLQSIGWVPVETAFYAGGLQRWEGTLLSGLAECPPGPQMSHMHLSITEYKLTAK